MTVLLRLRLARRLSNRHLCRFGVKGAIVNLFYTMALIYLYDAFFSSWNMSASAVRSKERQTVMVT